MPIVLTAPHGGSAVVPGVAVRTNGTIVQDERTREITDMVADKLESRFCQRPYTVEALFHRRYIDANRPEAEAFEQPAARPYYLGYHQQVRSYVDEVRQLYPDGAILVDVHGQAENPDTIHRGTQNGLTMKGIVDRRGVTALVGENSIFGRLQALGYTVFPANTPPGNPRESPLYNGGYTVQTYGSHQPNGIDAIQIEIGANFRRVAALPQLTDDLTDAIGTYYTTFVKDQPRCDLGGSPAPPDAATGDQ
jgi:N-formylglutamate amidohydrolase